MFFHTGDPEHRIVVRDRQEPTPPSSFFQLVKSTFDVRLVFRVLHVQSPHTVIQHPLSRFNGRSSDPIVVDSGCPVEVYVESERSYIHRSP